MKASKSDLVSRKIMKVVFRPLPDGRGGKYTQPLITLDNGRRVWFLTQETGVGDYGTMICISEETSHNEKS